jgi:CelD/BcsL family acetyltransferase involved in cellulose biosynthesis
MLADAHLAGPFVRVAHPNVAVPEPAPVVGAAPAADSNWDHITLAIGADLAALEADWRSFEAGADGTAFQTYDWLWCWQRHIGAPAGVRPLIVTGRDASGSLVFLFALAVERRGFMRRLTWLGADLCDYNGPLLARDFGARYGARPFADLWARILERVRAVPGVRFDTVDLPKLLDRVGEQANPFLALPTRANASGAWVATLGSDWESYYAATRSGPTRKKERKQLKQLGEHGAVIFAEAGEAETIRPVVETLIGYKSAAFARMGVADNLSQPGYRAFYLDLTTRPSARRLAHVTHLDVGGRVVAASLGLRFGGDYCLVLSSYEDGALSRFGPGRAHLNDLIHHAVDNGFRRFDFTIGDEAYKRDWADVAVVPRDHLRPVTLQGAAVVVSMLGFRALKRFIKQTPALWSLFLQARALKARLSGGAKRPVAAESAEAD